MAEQTPEDEVAWIAAAWADAKVGIVPGELLRCVYRNKGLGLEIVGWMSAVVINRNLMERPLSFSLHQWRVGMSYIMSTGLPFIIAVRATDGLWMATFKPPAQVEPGGKLYIAGNPQDESEPFRGATISIPPKHFKDIGSVRQKKPGRVAG